MSLTPRAISVVKATAGVVAPHALDITKCFYGKLFSAHPSMYAFFNKANQRNSAQPAALADAVVAYASNIDNLGALSAAVPLMAHKHCGLQVLPEHYQTVHDTLMEAIADVLGDAVTPEIGAGWSEAVMGLAGILIETEEGLYAEAEARQGGWRGWRDFKVSSKEVAGDVAMFSFSACDGYTGGFGFTAGQYVTLNLGREGEAPRHYTATSKPGSATLDVAVKRVDGGVVSNILHDEIAVGDVIKLAPPFGVFTPPSSPTVCVSAGIGCTPMVSFLNSSSHVVGALHVDRTCESNPFVGAFESALGNKFSTIFTSTRGEPSAEEVVAAAAVPVGATVYVCGPPGFMAKVVPAFQAAGSPVQYENFGPRTKL